MFKTKINVQNKDQCSKQRSMFKTKINVQNKDQCSKQRSMFKTKILQTENLVVRKLPKISKG